MPSKVIAEHESIILKKDTNYKVFKVIKSRNATFCKEKFHLDNFIGQSYGGSYKVEKGQLVKLNHEELLALTEKPKNEDEVISNGDEDKTNEGVKDNRNLIDKNENQKLTKEEIGKLRKEGITGNEIVGHLIENSSTFSKKTDYSKEKYIKKKTKKHVTVFTLLEANTRNLQSMYYSRGPTKICNLRMDSLAQILTYANVRAGGRYLVVDNCSGLVLGSMIERMNGQGVIMNLYSGSAPSQPAIELGYNFSEDQKQILHGYPLDRIATVDAVIPSDETEDNELMDIDVIIDSGDESDEDEGVDDGDENNDNKDNDCKKRKRHKDREERDRRREAKRMRITESTRLLLERNMDGLIVASKFHPTPIVLSLMKFLMPSRPIVVFCPYSEPLVDCYSHLKDRGDVLLMKLSENWLRSFQILPERSHPHVNMSGSGGFLLTGMLVKNE